MKCKECEENLINYVSYSSKHGYKVMRFVCKNQHKLNLKIIEDDAMLDKVKIYNKIKKLFGEQT